jgi:hypothetical protein
LQYVEVSAKQGTNIKKLFEIITSSLYESHNFPTNKDKTVVLDQPFRANDGDKKQKCCAK